MNYGTLNSSTSRYVVAQAPADVRAAFIRKVYGLFFLSILVTVGAGAFCAQPAIAPAAWSMRTLLMIGAFVCILVLSFVRRVNGLNLLLLALFSALEGAILGPLLVLISQANPGVVTQAGWLTIAVFGGLSLYAIQSRKDFSYLGGMLFVALIGLLVAGFVMFFVHIPLMSTIYSLFGVLIFSGYVLYDTSQIQLRLTEDEAVLGAVSLYLDFLNLFLFILNLLSNRRD